MKAIKKDAAKINHDYLNALTEERDLVENNKLSHYIWRLILIEQQVTIHKRINLFTSSVEHKSIVPFTIPQDSAIE